MRFLLKQFYALKWTGIGWAALLLLILNSAPAFSQQNQLNRITLNWNSFRKVNSNNRPYIAYTAHQTRHKYRATQNGKHLSLQFEVGVTLDSSQTIIDLSKLKSLGNADKKALLNHEQGHSDLAVIYGRILYQRLSRKNYSIGNFKKEVKVIYDAVMKELAGKNRTYDIETEHGQYAEQQQKWDVYFKKELLKNPGLSQ
ncbi:DUF922 domain-containing protein [Pedobacter steynii]|uniref:DUF922 domain-containing protein n=1 Tax=Pedobacter steynii TaxID=430522 RepID=A0A1D7QN82_9SPHI|nr:DUF922 domain-containing protein [Pedobacter steynii]AOM80128.1 hypothetical protein BFS30_24985 [Pedobacter steynii]